MRKEGKRNVRKHEEREGDNTATLFRLPRIVFGRLSEAYPHTAEPVSLTCGRNKTTIRRAFRLYLAVCQISITDGEQGCTSCCFAGILPPVGGKPCSASVLLTVPMKWWAR